MPLVPSYIETLEPYRPGKPIGELRRELGITRVVKLASNENPLGASPAALDAIRAAVADLHLYPNGGLDLREALAARFGLGVESVIAGSGSEGILLTIVRTFLTRDAEVITSEGTFVGFYVLARAAGVTLRLVPQRDYRFDLPALARAITDRTRLVYLANPNNPTGTMFTRAEFEGFLRDLPPTVVVILDEAYFEYASGHRDYPDSLNYRRENLITLRTFSKIYGLAGIRVGYGFADPAVIAHLLKVKLPFEPSSLAQAAGIAALGDEAFLRRSLAVNEAGRNTLVPVLRSLGLSVVPSVANFVLVPFPDERHALQLYDGLLRRGIIVRPLRAFGLPHCLRITIGTPEENEELVRAMRAIMQGS